MLFFPPPVNVILFPKFAFLLECDLTKAVHFVLLLLLLCLSAALAVPWHGLLMWCQLCRLGSAASPSAGTAPEPRSLFSRLPALPLITVSPPRELLNHSNIADRVTDGISHRPLLSHRKHGIGWCHLLTGNTCFLFFYCFISVSKSQLPNKKPGGSWW